MANIYKVSNGKRVKLSPTAIKNEIMKANNWTSDQYRKNYDIFKNKLRAYESYKSSHGEKVKPQSVVEVLYKQAKAKTREGASYKPSAEMKRIQSFSAVSISKGRQLTKSAKYQAKRNQIFAEATAKQFKGFIDNNPVAREIYERIEDPVKREQALKDYADKVHAKIAESREEQENAAIPYGETYGSDEATDFDIEAYL